MKRDLARMIRMVSVATLPLLVAAQGCSDEVGSQTEDITQKSDYEVDFAKANELYPDEVPATNMVELKSVRVKVGENFIPAQTHTFGPVFNIIPYSNNDNEVDASGAEFARGDQEIAKVFGPNAVGFAVKNHRSEYRTLDLNGGDPNSLKEHFKLQDTHLQIVVGVEKAEHGFKGAISLNNPQNYEQGKWGDDTYAMDFFRIEFPNYVSPEQQKAYIDNIRTMTVGFNTVSNFPGDYNGGDPLGATTPARVRQHVDNMIRAIAGDAAGEAYFDDPANLIYCAELGYLGLNAGILDPLNAETMVPRVGQATWDAFTEEVQRHNESLDAYTNGGELGSPSAFTTGNDNKRVALVRLNLADPSMRSIADLAPDPAAVANDLAWAPMTMSDIVESFMRTHIPRQELGEALAPAQGAVLAAMKPGLLEKMGMDQMPENDPRRVAVEALFDQLVTVVSTPYGSYEEFRTNVEPLLAQARAITGPRDDSGTGLFVPPSIFHLVAQGKWGGGFIKLQYEGHGMHVSATKKIAAPAPVEPTPVEDISSETSCVDHCGASAGECYCDSVCSTYGDCCDDYQAVCGG